MKKLLYLLFLLPGLAKAQGSGVEGFFSADATTTPTGPSVCTVADPDAQKFVTAARLSDCTVAGAVNQLVVSLKQNNLWNKIAALYPYASDGVLKTREEQHRYNLKDTAAFKITWSSSGGTVVHSSAGVTFNGANCGATGLIPATHLTLNDVHLAVYHSGATSAGHVMGAANSASAELLLSTHYHFDAYNATTGQGRVFPGGGAVSAFAIGTRTSATSFAIYKNGSIIGAAGTTSGGTQPTVEVLVGKSSGSGTAHTSALNSIGAGLSAAEVATFSTIVNQYQATLNRNVY